MVALIRSCTLVGVDAALVEVECEVSRGLPGYSVVGLASPSVKEGAVRIKSALNSVGHDLPLKRVTVNLAPADLRKPGCALDLPIALAVLVADEVFAGAVLQDLLIVGELGLDGTVRSVRGVLAAATLAKHRNLRGIVVPATCVAEAVVVDGLEVYGVSHLSEVIAVLAGTADWPPHPATRRRRRLRVIVDMAEIRGQCLARQALEVAVAGGHNVLLAGPPGTGKTMLARRLSTVLPPMTRDEALETTKVYSALGLADGLLEERPFRAPHHTISTAALLGGGSVPRPGEISLAHNGVLFLDELPEFARGAIESLRQPLEERVITIGRIHSTIQLPASFLLVGAANPCPCGWLESRVRECVCSRASIERYRLRLSGPLLDRIDLHVHVKPVSLGDLRDDKPAEASERIRDRVIAARDRQHARLAPFGLRFNAEMPAAVMRATCRLDDACEKMLAAIVARREAITARGIDRLLKVTRTVADLRGLEDIDPECLDTAASYRDTDPVTSVMARVA